MLAALILSACSNSIGSVDAPKVLGSELAKPPAEIAAPCREPEALGKDALGAADVVDHWSRDRESLADCRDRKAAESKFYGELLKGIANK